MRRWTDSVLRLLARAACRTYYREITLVGEERIPASRPIIFVGNHGNGLIDPALAMGYLPATVRFIAKATLWKHPFVAPFVRLAAAIPIERRQDPGADMERNVNAFRAAIDLLCGGGMLCIFPEGMSHGEPSLQRMKTGTARIALETATESPGLELMIVPFGLAFSRRDRFRSRAGLVFGDPISVTAAPPDLPWSEVESLTAEIENGLQAVTLNYSSWHEHRLVRRAVDLFLRDPGRSGQRPIANRLNTHRLFVTAYRELQSEHPAETAAAAAAVLEYDRLLTLVGLTDRQVLEPVPLSRLLSLATRSLAYLLIAMPLAAIGFVIHALPYAVARYLPRLTRQPLHQRASWSVMSGVFLVPAIWIGLTVLAVRAWGWWGCLVLVLAPLSGWAALRVAETLHRLWRTTQGLLITHLASSTRQTLLDRRREAQRAVADLAEIYTGP